MEAVGAIQVQEIKTTDPFSRSTGTGRPTTRGQGASESGSASEGSKQREQERIQQIVQMLKDYIRPTRLKINVDQGTGAIAVKIISEKDGSVIREIPPEALRNLAAKMKEMMGLLFDKKV